MTIKLNYKQHEFIEGFKKRYDKIIPTYESLDISDSLPFWADIAIHNIINFGHGSAMKDADGYEVSNDDKENFGFSQRAKLISAIINGYELDVIGGYMYMEFADNSGMDYETRRVYYGKSSHVTNKMTASYFSNSQSDEVKMLMEKGWKFEEEVE